MPKIKLENYAKQYVDTLLESAKTLGIESVMGQACLLRADHLIDFIKAWKEYEKKS